MISPGFCNLDNKVSYLCNSLLDRVPRDKSVDHDFVGLPDPVGAGEGLDVVVRIPVGIIDDDSIRCGQIDAQTSGSGGQQERKLWRIRCCRNTESM